jgi:hypothetical protein
MKQAWNPPELETERHRMAKEANDRRMEFSSPILSERRPPKKLNIYPKLTALASIPVSHRLSPNSAAMNLRLGPIKAFVKPMSPAPMEQAASTRPLRSPKATSPVFRQRWDRCH